MSGGKGNTRDYGWEHRQQEWGALDWRVCAPCALAIPGSLSLTEPPAWPRSQKNPGLSGGLFKSNGPADEAMSVREGTSVARQMAKQKYSRCAQVGRGRERQSAGVPAGARGAHRSRHPCKSPPASRSKGRISKHASDGHSLSLGATLEAGRRPPVAREHREHLKRDAVE